MVFKQVRGIFPYFKEKGIHANDVRDWTFLSLSDEFSIPLKSQGIKLKFPFPLEPNSTGIMALSLGNLDKYMRYSLFLEMEYSVQGMLGSSTSTLESSGQLLEEKAYDHVTREQLTAACNSFLGVVKQRVPSFIPRKTQIITEKLWDETRLETYMKSKESRHEMNRNRIYWEGKVYKEFVCYQIEVLDFNPPHFSLRILTEGGFNCRSFIHDLGQKLDTLAHMSDCRRERFGPFKAEDGLRKYQLYWPEIKESCDKYTKLFVNNCRPHLDRITMYSAKRLR
jgi:tRNA pseudouridine55 synthase